MVKVVPVMLVVGLVALCGGVGAGIVVWESTMLMLMSVVAVAAVVAVVA